ncbi:MAG: hypothetical protein C4293_08195 [Nitrospiraceae bacterium]
MMLRDRYIDMEETGQMWIEAWRCSNCGDVVDDRIKEHRLLRTSGARISMSGEMPIPWASLP